MCTTLARRAQQSEFTSATKAVFVRLCAAADGFGFACASMARLADGAGISYDTARYHIRKLKAAGAIVSIARRATDGGGRLAPGTQVSNGWKIVFSWDGETPEEATRRLIERDPCSAVPTLFPPKLAPVHPDPEPDEAPVAAEIVDISRQARKAFLTRGAPVQSSTPIYMLEDIITTLPKRSLKRSKKVSLQTPEELEIEGVRQRWNERLVDKGYPRMIRVTDKFRKKFRARAKESGFSWGMIFRILEADDVKPFFNHEERHPSNWITPGWIVDRASNWERIAEGKYHNVGTEIDDDLDAGAAWAEAAEQAKRRNVNRYAIEAELDELGQA